MRGSFTSNGLELLYSGEFKVDFTSHTVTDLAAMFNSNMLSLDDALIILNAISVKVDTLEFKGHVAGIFNGGVSGEQPETIDVGITRVIHNRFSDAEALPAVTVPTVAEDLGLFKNELAVNSYASGDLINDAPGIWLRVGSADTAEVGDKLIRIGRALVTDDIDTALSPTVPFDDASVDVVWTGELWLRSTDHAFFVHDGTEFHRVTTVSATDEVEGTVRYATDIEVLQGTSDVTAITPADLSLWKEDLELLSRRRSSNEIHVDQTIGYDGLENDGKDAYKPFLTLNRALLEVSRQSFVAGFNNDRVNDTTIIVHIGDYLLDNRPGSSDYTTLSRQGLTDVGAINPITSEANITTVSLDAVGNTVLTIAGLLTAGVTVNSNIWNADFSASGVVVSVTNTEIVLRNVKGTWASTVAVKFSDYSVFNSPQGGVVVPRGCSIIGIDLRKTLIRPRYIGDFVAWQAAVAGTECQCTPIGSTERFLLTGNSYISNLTLLDNQDIKESHHLCIGFGFARPEDINSNTYGYYRKVFQVLGNTVAPAIVLDEYQFNSLELNIVNDAIDNTVTDSDGFRLVDGVKGSSPYISNCSLLSRFGARGLVADGARVGGFQSIVVERFTNVSLQDDERAFEANANAPGGKVYKPQWRHASIEALSGGYIQAVSCFTIGPAIHYSARDGGEISVANCFTNFGDTAFDAYGHSISAYPQDQGAVSLQLIPPKPITSTTQALALGSYRHDLSSATRLYVYDDELTEERISPFSLLGGELLSLKTPENVEFTAELVDTAPFFEQDVDEQWYINVKGIANNIYSNGEDLDAFFVSIKRTPDTRAQADRIYWLQVEGLEVADKRSPQRNYILKFNSDGSSSYSFDTTLWIAAVRDRDTDGNAFGEGIYQIALLQAAGQNDKINDLYPALDLNVPQVNPATSKTYQAMNTLLAAIGASTNDALSLLVESTDPRLLLDSNSEAQSIFLDFVKPSTIRAFGTGIEWIGYGNYSSAIPKYQDYEFNITERFSKIKQERDGGRVYNVGMTDDGKFIVGDTIVDVTGGEETNVNLPFEDSSKVLKNLTVTNRLFMYPGSKMQLGGSIVSLDANTTFVPTITTDFAVYGNQTAAGFTRFATTIEADALTASNVAIAPSTIPISSQTQVGITRFATTIEADALSDITVALTPGTTPISSETQRGVIRLGTEAEANALTLNSVAVSPANLPIASETQLGLSQKATQVEVNALTDAIKYVTPDTLPIASETQQGIVRFATDLEVDESSDLDIAVKPSDIERLYKLLKQDEVGVCKFFAGSVAPAGYLLCRGQAVSRSDYAALFDVIGTTWGIGDGVDTFNLPPADRVFIAASTTIGYVHGTIGGAATSTATTTTDGEHTHTNTVSLAGGHTHTASTAASGSHTPEIVVLEAGEHNHVITIAPGGAQAVTGITLANDPVVPSITMGGAGGHTHNTTLAAAGGHAHTGTALVAGEHTPQITVESDGSHNHAAAAAGWGPYSFSGFVTAAGGSHTPIITTQFAGAHSHGGTANAAGAHAHSVMNGGSGANGGNSGPLTLGDAGDHTHFLQIETGGLHNHVVDVVTVPDHIHSLPTLTLPAHSHVITLAADPGHTHDLLVEEVPGHVHTLSISSEPNHTHTATVASVLDHTHSLTINQIDGHVHTLSINALPNHIHTASSNLTGAHFHDLTIEEVPNHTHTMTVGTEPDHNHTVTNDANGDHEHDVTVSTIQPYAAMNVIIYTGVY